MRFLTAILAALLCLAPATLAVAGDDPGPLKRKVTKLVNTQFGGDWDKAHAHYVKLGEDEAGGLEQADLKVMLEDAGVGNWLTRAMKAMDKDGNERISRAELRWTDYNTHDPGTTLD